jgi:hypothetical protein
VEKVLLNKALCREGQMARLKKSNPKDYPDFLPFDFKC